MMKSSLVGHGQGIYAVFHIAIHPPISCLPTLQSFCFLFSCLYSLLVFLVCWLVVHEQMNVHQDTREISFGFSLYVLEGK